MPAPTRYRVSDGLSGGAYPGSSETIADLEREGVTVFIDLTHPSDPVSAYAHRLRTARRLARPIRDMGTPTAGRMMAILDEIDRARACGATVLVHCWGGVGRTGTVIGCWLVRHGLDEGDPIARIAELRRDVPGARTSPETPGQIAFVRGWRRGW